YFSSSPQALHSSPTRRSSDLIKRTFPPNSVANSSPFSFCKSKMMAFPPCATIFLTVASPKPEAPPVTTATQSCTSIRLHSPHHLRFCRSEEHTSELQSRFDIVCRLLLEK